MEINYGIIINGNTFTELLFIKYFISTFIKKKKKAVKIN